MTSAMSIGAAFSSSENKLTKHPVSFKFRAFNLRDLEYIVNNKIDTIALRMSLRQQLKLLTDLSQGKPISTPHRILDTLTISFKVLRVIIRKATCRVFHTTDDSNS